MDDHEKTLAEMLGRASTDIIKAEVQRTAFLAQQMAEMGLGTTLAAQFGRPPDAPDTAATTVVILLSGRFPQDLVDGLIKHVNGLIQDFRAGNKAHFVDLRPKKHETPE
jgi:hypothetical protein